MEFLEGLEISNYIQLLASFLGAFFAFLFYAILEAILTSQRKQSRKLKELNVFEEFLVALLTGSEFNIERTENFISSEASNPVSISINSDFLTPLPTKEDFLKSLENNDFNAKIAQLNVKIRVINNNINIINDYEKVVSRISERAITEERVESYKVSLAEHRREIKNRVEENKENLINLKEEVNTVWNELKFEKAYIKSFCIKRWWVKIKMILNSNYREEKIKKFDEEKDNNGKVEFKI